MDVDLSRLPLNAATHDEWLVDEDAGVRQGKALAFLPAISRKAPMLAA